MKGREYLPSKEQPDAPELTQDELALLVNGVEANHLVDFLKYADDLSAKVLQGFRLNRQAVKTPIVQQRLVNEALRDGILRDTLIILWRESISTAISDTIDGLSARDLEKHLPDLAKAFGGERIWLFLLLNDRKTVRKLSGKWKDRLLAIMEEPPEASPRPPRVDAQRQPESKTPEDERLRKLREERTGLLEEIRRIKPQLAEAVRLAEKDKADAHAIHKQLAEANKHLESLQRRLQKEEQARKAVESEIGQLKRTIKRLETSESHPQDEKKPSSQPLPQAEIWPEIITRMLNNDLRSEAIAFCEELVKRRPDSVKAHELLYRAYTETRQPDLALEECWWIGERLISDGNLPAAAYVACSAVGLDPQSKRTAKILDKLLKKLDLRNKEVTQEVRTAFRRYSGRYPEAYKQVSAAITRAGAEYKRALEGQSQVGLDTLFSLEYSGRRKMLSARDIVKAILSNNVAVVDIVRLALPDMKAAHAPVYRNLIGAIESCDAGCGEILLRKTSPIVVDGSNVAFAYATSSGKPRLNNIRLVRKTLHSQGYFPIYIYADANLRYKIDQGATMEQMIDAGEILCVDSGTDADETILLEARRRNCPIVTNDRMLEWDPDGEVEKIRFDADQGSVELRPW